MLDIIKRGFIEQFPTQRVMLQHAQLLAQVAHATQPSILIAAMPKSASTFLSHVVSLASGYRRSHFVYGWERNAQDLYLPSLLRSLGAPVVVQQHTIATSPNLELIRIFNLRTIVLVRNIFDVVMSILDHSMSEDFKGPAGYLTEDYLAMDQETKLDMIIDSIVPWYFGFFVSWQEAQAKGLCDVHWMTYRQLVTDSVATVQPALEFCRVNVSAADISDAVAAAKTDPQAIRFNKGVRGRGEAALSATQKQRIARLARYYPSIDFSLIGIPRVCHGTAQQATSAG